MARTDRQKAARLKPPSADRDYTIGYAKPPADTRFKQTERIEEPDAPTQRGALQGHHPCDAYRTIKVNDGDRRGTIPMAQAVVRALVAKGQQRAQQLFAELLSSTERANKALYDEYLETMIEYKVSWEKENRRCKTLGVVAPEPLPHPDDIFIDMKTGEAHVYGPMTQEEKAVWDSLRQRLDDSIEEIEELTKLAADPESASCRHVIEKDIAFEIRIRDRIQDAIGDWPNRRGRPRGM